MVAGICTVHISPIFFAPRNVIYSFSAVMNEDSVIVTSGAKFYTLRLERTFVVGYAFIFTEREGSECLAL
jgi:hypothetical protein